MTTGARVKPRLPRGMRDILPELMVRRQYVIDVIRGTFEEFGFEPLQTPAIELSETLTGKYGPDAERLMYFAGHPIDQERLMALLGESARDFGLENGAPSLTALSDALEGYQGAEARRFVANLLNHTLGGEQLSLRYDLSVPLARVVAMYSDLRLPFKRYQIAPVWRADRPQRGRYREFYQCDADTVGTTSMLADAETLNVIDAILTRLGFTRFTINLNDRKIINGIGQYAGVPDELLGGLYRSIDKLDKIGMDGVREELRRNAIPDDVVARLMDLLAIEGPNDVVLAGLAEQLREYPEALEGIEELQEIRRYLIALGVPDEHYTVNFAMVRGLEYYTGPIYETTIEEPPMPSITGGGRFDRLIGMFSDRSFPATGTTIGIERIMDAMIELDMFPPNVGRTVVQVLVTLFSSDMIDQSLAITSNLRKNGLHVQMQYEPASLKSQIKYATSKGIPILVILGPDEAAAGEVTIRNLVRGEQHTIAQAEMVDTILRWLTP